MVAEVEVGVGQVVEAGLVVVVCVVELILVQDARLEAEVVAHCWQCQFCWTEALKGHWYYCYY